MGYNRALNLFAVFTAASVFFLIIAGGLVTSTGSGLAVPDWPLSYGKVMPPMVGGIFYEHGHRMVATFVGILTVLLAVWLWRRDERSWVRKLGFIALATVIVQGLLGGITVLFYLPTVISVTHATLAQTFFCLVAGIALFTSRWWRKQDEGRSLREFHEYVGGKRLSLVTLVSLTTVSVYIQLILGALMRHTGSGLAVPDLPLAYGQLLPALSADALAAYNQQLIHSGIRIAAEGAITASQIVIHMVHRGWALVVTAMVVWTAVRLIRASANEPRFATFGTLLIGLLLVQMTLGVLTVLSVRDVAIATAHVAGGALILVTCVLTSLHVFKLAGVQWPGRGVALSPREVPA